MASRQRGKQQATYTTLLHCTTALNLLIYGQSLFMSLAKRPTGDALMTTFDKRQEGFEKKFAHDEELRFKATARRNKLLGLWAAEKMGLSGAEADTYAKEVVQSDFEEAGDEDVFRKIRKDFDAKKVDQSDHQIRRTMDELMATAMDQLKNQA
jgi:hypothetical protein